MDAWTSLIAAWATLPLPVWSDDGAGRPGAPLLLASTAAVFVLAGLVKGVVGLGLPTVSMGLMALLMPPAQAAALLVVPSLVTNVWQMGPRASLPAMLRRLAPMQAGVAVGTLGGAFWLGPPSGAAAMAWLGLALVVYGAWGIVGAQVTVARHGERWLGPLAGLATGLLTAATGVFVVPAVAYLQALGLKRDELVQAMGLSFTVSTVALAIGLGVNARWTGALLALSVGLLLPALLGMLLGQRLRQRLSPAVFRRCLLASLLLLGLHLLVQHVPALLRGG